MIPSFSVIVPTYRPGDQWENWLEAYAQQTVRPSMAIIIDSSSEDGTVELAARYGFEVKVIRQADFNHGRTRQLGVEWTGDSEVVVFLTQDAVLSAPDSLEKLIASFVDPEVGAAYGRQLPRSGASLIAAHARLFNYPPVSRIKSIQDAPELGVKTFFISNSFAAYRRAALMEVGGFPHDTILAEDNIVSARMLLNGWKVAYVADAQVYHSHNYTLMQEFRRYFDIGAFHSHESWILERFGRAEGEGARFVRSELLFLWREGPTLIPSSVLRTAAKFIAYRLFAIAKFLPVRLKKRLSMQAHLSRPE